MCPVTTSEFETLLLLHMCIKITIIRIIPPLTLLPTRVWDTGNSPRTMDRVHLNSGLPKIGGGSYLEESWGILTPLLVQSLERPHLY